MCVCGVERVRITEKSSKLWRWSQDFSKATSSVHGGSRGLQEGNFSSDVDTAGQQDTTDHSFWRRFFPKRITPSILKKNYTL
jgi:hypothetical protein